MPVTINTNVIRAVPQVNDDGLVLVIFKYARQTAGTVLPQRINTLDELYDTYSVNAGTAAQVKQSRRELIVAEYLLTMGVNLIVLATDAIGVLDADDLAKIDEVDNYGFKIVLAPYSLQTSTTVDTLLIDYAVERDVELFLDIDPSQVIANIEDTQADVKAAINSAILVSYSPRVQLFVNSGLVSGLISNYSVAGYLMTDYIPADGDSVHFYGIPLSAIVAARKSALLIANTPWIPVAGEVYGLVPEYVSLFKNFLRSEKTDIQDKDINLVITKTGIGAVIVAQNTLARVSSSDADKINPLIRGHVVTQALWLKRRLRSITESIIFSPHIAKTYDAWQLKVNHIMDNMKSQDGVTSYATATGPKVMTSSDILNNIFKGVVTYHPINVIESAVITMNILESEDDGVLIEGV